MAEAAMAIAAVVGAGMSIKGSADQEKARQVADNQAGRDAAKRADMELAARNKMAQDAADAASMATRDAAKRQQLASRLPNKGGTMLTGPLGVPNAAAPTAGKTLLGQ